jgi:hypothetical protein
MSTDTSAEAIIIQKYIDASPSRKYSIFKEDFKENLLRLLAFVRELSTLFGGGSSGLKEFAFDMAEMNIKQRITDDVLDTITLRLLERAAPIAVHIKERTVDVFISMAPLLFPEVGELGGNIIENVVSVVNDVPEDCVNDIFDFVNVLIMLAIRIRCSRGEVPHDILTQMKALSILIPQDPK